MTVLSILRMGHPVLLAIAEPVDDPASPDIRQLASDMVDTMDAEGGIGIAAPQVGRSLRLIVALPIDGREEAAAVDPLIVANPVLEPVGIATEEAIEGCLSIPALRGQVPRSATVRWQGQDLFGDTIGGVAHGLFARILQHEVDHLDGILYPMRMTDLRTLAFIDAVPPEPGGDDAPLNGDAPLESGG